MDPNPREDAMIVDEETSQPQLESVPVSSILTALPVPKRRGRPSRASSANDQREEEFLCVCGAR